MANRSFCAIILIFGLLFNNQAFGIGPVKKIKYGLATVVGIVVVIKFFYEAWSRLGFFELKQDVKDLKSDTKVLKEDTNLLKKDTKVLKEDTGKIIEDTSDLKTSVEGVREKVEDVKKALQTFDGKTDENFQNVRSDISDTKSELMQKISDTKQSLAVLIGSSEKNIRQDLESKCKKLSEKLGKIEALVKNCAKSEDMDDLKELLETVKTTLVAKIEECECRHKIFLKSELQGIKESIDRNDESTGDLVAKVNKIGDEVSDIRKILTNLQALKLLGGRDESICKEIVNGSNFSAV